MTTIFVLSIFCILGGCGLLDGLGGNGDGNDPLDSNTTRYLHFVDVDGNTLLDYKLDKTYSETDLLAALDRVVVDYHSPANGKYLDGTDFSTDRKKLNDYVVKHDTDTFAKNYPAYTVVMQMVAITHTVQYYVDGQLFESHDYTYEQWSHIVPPQVPSKAGQAGKWDKNPAQLVFQDCRVDAVYQTVTAIRSADDWNLISQNPNGYYELESDLDFDGKTMPVISEFNGTLDGKGHKVLNVTLQNTNCASNYALFAVNNGEIKNIIFRGGTCVLQTATTREVEDVNLAFLTAVNNGQISDVTVEEMTVNIKCYYASNSTQAMLENWLSAGILAATNNGEISYVTVADTVSADMDSQLLTVRSASNPNAELTLWASYGLVAGRNKGRVMHATADAATLSSRSTLQRRLTASDATYNIINLYIRVGGIVGANESASFVNNCYSNSTVYPTHEITNDIMQFTNHVEVGGIAGCNRGFVNSCVVGEDAHVMSRCNADTYIGGIVGMNQGNIHLSYSRAWLTMGNRGDGYATYCGGVAGYVDGGNISYSYAIVGRLTVSAVANESKAYFGGVFGYSNNGRISSSFASVSAAGKFNSNGFGAYANTTFDAYCYLYLAETATDYQPSDRVNVCATLDQLFAGINNNTFEAMGYEISQGNYPTLSDVGNNK